MKPVYRDDAVTLYQADCYDFVRGHVALKQFSASILDPPYGVSIDVWDKVCPHAYVNVLAEVTEGPIVWFGAAPKLTLDVKSFPVEPQRVLIWAPAFTLARVMANGLAFRYHTIFAWNLPKKHDGPKWDVLNVSTESGNPWKYTCTKPLRLMEMLVGFCPKGGTVFDPFAGTGTTLLAARNRGRKAVGVELTDAGVEIAIKRLRGEYPNKRAKQKKRFAEAEAQGVDVLNPRQLVVPGTAR